MTTIRMTKASKENMKLHTAVHGRAVVQRAIARYFDKNHADVKVEDEVDDPRADVEWDAGLRMNAMSIGLGRMPSVSFRGMRGNSNYYSVGHQITNPSATPHDGIKVYKWDWQGDENTALMEYTMNLLTRVAKASGIISTKDISRNKFNDAWNVVQQAYTELERMLYWLGVELLNGATTIVSKRASPYEHSHYVVRGDNTYGNSDYNTYSLLGIKKTGGITRLIRQSLPLIRTYMDAVIKQRRDMGDIKYNQDQLIVYQNSLTNSQDQLAKLIAQATEGGNTIEEAIEQDKAMRQEVIDYLENMPHQDHARVPHPNFNTQRLESKINSLETNISQYELTVAKWTVKVAETTSGLANMELNVASIKMLSHLKLKGVEMPTTEGDSQ